MAGGRPGPPATEAAVVLRLQNRVAGSSMRPIEFARRFKDEVKRDRLGDIAAMLTYYALFALFPMLIFVIIIALLVVPSDVLAQGTAMATQAMPHKGAQLIQAEVARMQQMAGGGLALGSAAVALWGASRGSLSLGRALNRVYDHEETRPWWRVQLTGIAVTVAVALLLVAALALLVAGPVVGHFLAQHIGMSSVFHWVWLVVRWVGAALLVMFIWALLYKFLPDTRAPLHVFSTGALVGVILWIAISVLFAIYVQNFGSYDRVYGALGGVVIFLTWMWLSNVAMLAGAEVNDVLDRDRRTVSA